MVRRTVIFLCFISFIFSGTQCNKWAKYAKDTSLTIYTDPIILTGSEVNFEVTFGYPVKVLRNLDSIKHIFYYEKGNNYGALAEIYLTKREFDKSTKQFQKTFFINKKLDISSDTTRMYLQSDYYRNGKSLQSPKLQISRIIKNASSLERRNKE